VEITADVTVSATTAAAATTCITGNAVAYDGSTRICIEVYSPAVITASTSNAEVLTQLWDGSTDLGRLAYHGRGDGTRGDFNQLLARRFLTPTAATHTYSIRAYRTAGNGTWGAGAGGADANLPAYLRITRA